MNKKTKKSTKKTKKVISRQDAEEALKSVIDPELGINIVDLGLVYNLVIRSNSITLKMTLTFPGCPLAGPITRQAQDVLEKIPNVKTVKVFLVWDPPWTPDMVKKEAREELGLG